MPQKTQLSVIIPAKNEAASLPELLSRLHHSFTSSHLSYQAILVDDRSTDSTREVIRQLSSQYPIVYMLKQGPIGKAFSIIEASKAASAPVLAMIDADLEYPPEALPAMYNQLIATSHGVVVADRRIQHSHWVRSLLSGINRLVFGWLFLGLKCDVQSGLKVFRREVIDQLDQRLVGAWSIDMPLLYTARELGLTVGTLPIDFISRPKGTSKRELEFVKAVRDIVLGAVRIKLAKSKIYRLPNGLAYRGRRYITHTRLPLEHSAFITILPWQKMLLASVLFLLSVCFLIVPLSTGIVLVAILSLVYFADTVFSAALVYLSLRRPPELAFTEEQLAKHTVGKLPVYTILCPLYKEAAVLPHFVASISQLDWPESRLEVLLLLEENDSDTISAARAAGLPSYIKTVIVPASQPQTKPKACNYGLGLATGEYLVIYDAEDRPEPDQLKKAYLAFQRLPARVACLQAKLNYYNPHQNVLTRLFTAEYSLWFDLILPGLQSINTAIPLGGTSNHFRTQVLRKLHGWDSFNVTEDCDLGTRLFKLGYTTAIIDSTTYEEANSALGNWLRQRSRWIKGYLQTWLVHNRQPLQFIKRHGVHAFIFQLIIGGRTFFMLINPLLWLATFSYFAFRPVVGATIESLYPAVVFYLAGLSAVFGNFLFLYYYMVGLGKRGLWSTVKYVYLVPLYWVLVSLAAVKALYQLVFRPHYWEKTHHGLAQTKPQAKWALPSFSLPALPRLPVISRPAINITLRLPHRPVLIFGRIILGLAWLSAQVAGLLVTHDNIGAAFAVIAFTTTSFIVTARLTSIMARSWWLFARLASDLRGLFSHFQNGSIAPGDHLRILVFNWRDIQHKWAGGAEVYLHEQAKRWVAEGHSVTVFCGSDGHNGPESVIDGVKIIRRGGFYTVYLLAPLYYLLRLRGHYDVVVDSENGIPFFTPLFVGVPKVLLIHHIHQDMFRNKLYFPMDQIALILESFFMPLIYRRQKIVTVSQSSAADILKIGLSPNRDVDIVHPGINPSQFTPAAKTTYPSFVYLGRIRPQKNLDIAILAFSKLLTLYPSARLTIAGWGDSLPGLKALVQKLHLDKEVVFAGKVSDSQRAGLLSSSWAMLQPSSFEGWGITVIEAAASGTPVIASDVAGLKDSVVANHTGLLVPPQDVSAWASAMNRIVADKPLRRRMAKNALLWSQKFNWDVQAAKFLTALKQHTQSVPSQVISPAPSYDRA